jgi:hypothetical protein
MSQPRALIEVDRWLSRGAGYIGIRGQMDDHIVSIHGETKTVEVSNLATHKPKALVSRIRLDVPFSARREIVKNRDDSILRLKQPPDKMAANKSRAANNEILLAPLAMERI